MLDALKTIFKFVSFYFLSLFVLSVLYRSFFYLFLILLCTIEFSLNTIISIWLKAIFSIYLYLKLKANRCIYNLYQHKFICVQVTSACIVQWCCEYVQVLPIIRLVWFAAWKTKGIMFLFEWAKRKYQVICTVDK